MDRRAAALLLLLSTIWGCSFIFIKMGDRSFAPMTIAFIRTALGASVLLAMVLKTGSKLPRSWSVWGKLALAALLSNTLPFALFGYGESHITAILAGLLNSVTPLATFPLAILAGIEIPSIRKFAGLALGMVGVMVVLGIWDNALSGSLLGSLACLLAAILYGAGFVYAKKALLNKGHGPLSLATGQLLAAATEALILTAWIGPGSHRLLLAPLVSVILLGVLGTGVAYLMSYHLMHQVGALGASLTTMIVPIFSTVAGAVVLQERIHFYQALGAILILGGAWLVQRRTIDRPDPRSQGPSLDPVS